MFGFSMCLKLIAKAFRFQFQIRGGLHRQSFGCYCLLRVDLRSFECVDVCFKVLFLGFRIQRFNIPALGDLSDLCLVSWAWI